MTTKEIDDMLGPPYSAGGITIKLSHYDNRLWSYRAGYVNAVDDIERDGKPRYLPDTVEEIPSRVTLGFGPPGSDRDLQNPETNPRNMKITKKDYEMLNHPDLLKKREGLNILSDKINSLIESFEKEKSVNVLIHKDPPNRIRLGVHIDLSKQKDNE